jgi:hypothetical protein
VANAPDGRWRIFHKSGNLAAEGAFEAGMRTGKWRFYYDTPAKSPIAVGRFASDGTVIGAWHHYDAEGKLLARSWTETPSQWVDNGLGQNGGDGSVLDVMPGADGVRHVVHQGTPGVDVEYNRYSVELFAKGKEKLYIADILGATAWYGADGVQLVHADDGTWTGTDCRWSTARKLIAQQGDIARVDGFLSNDAQKRGNAAKEEKYSELRDPGAKCTGGKVEISATRAKRLDALLASRDTVRSATPQIVRQLVIDQEDDVPTADDADLDADEIARRKAIALEKSDLARILAGSMAMYVEWPHIDRRFTQLYATMAGRYVENWANRSGADDDPMSTD